MELLAVGDLVRYAGFYRTTCTVVDIKIYPGEHQNTIKVKVKSPKGVMFDWDWRDIIKIVNGEEKLLSYEPLTKYYVPREKWNIKEGF